jgi:hypothetical protein
MKTITKINLLLLPVLLLAAPLARGQFDFSTNNGVITLDDYTGPGGPVDVPGFVNIIAANAFNETAITTISIPAGVTSIGDDAFDNTFSLTEMDFTGNAPPAFAVNNVFAVVYDLPGTTGWDDFSSATGLPVATLALPYPVILAFEPDFGPQPGGFSFDISWALNEPVVVEAATSLADPTWKALATITPDGVLTFTDSQSADFPQRFYRVHSTGPVTFVGNSLSVPNGGNDSVPPFVILGEYSPDGPLASSPIVLPSGTIQDVQFYGQNYDFTLYALSYVSAGPNPDEQIFQVDAAQSFSGNPSYTGIQTIPVSGFTVNAGDLLAFAGIGPFYPQNPNDALNSDATYEDSTDPDSFTATPPGGPGTQFTLGINPDPLATYEYGPDVFQNQGRTYGIRVDVLSP